MFNQGGSVFERKGRYGFLHWLVSNNDRVVISFSTGRRRFRFAGGFSPSDSAKNRARRQPRCASSGRPASATVIEKSHQRSSARSAAHLLQITEIWSEVAVSAAQARTQSSLPRSRSTRLAPACQRPVETWSSIPTVVWPRIP